MPASRRGTQDIGVTHRVDDDITRIEPLAGMETAGQSGPARTRQDRMEADHISASGMTRGSD